MSLIERVRRKVADRREGNRLSAISVRYQAFTMIPPATYNANLRVVDESRTTRGCVVECGVWKGGMSAGMAHLLGPDRQYFLFDSFEGLPKADAERDGHKAVTYQATPDDPKYLDNCTAAQADAEKAMQLSGAKHFTLIRGWFNETLPPFVPPEPIAVLRLDGDWYDSTMTCLRFLVPHLADRGIVILDDYGTWDGCSRATHDYLSETKSLGRIIQPHGVAVIDGAGPGATRRY